MSVEENVFKSQKNKNEEIKRFRNGDIIQYLTIVEIDEVVRSSGCIVKILENVR